VREAISAKANNEYMDPLTNVPWNWNLDMMQAIPKTPPLITNGAGNTLLLFKVYSKTVVVVLSSLLLSKLQSVPLFTKPSGHSSTHPLTCNKYGYVHSVHLSSESQTKQLLSEQSTQVELSLITGAADGQSVRHSC
jgi:hypothetical protein